jgi:hypothetical protein
MIFLFANLLYNNLLGVKMLFEIKKPRLTSQFLYLKQHFNTEEIIIQQTRKHYFINTK